jgi:hypothetical protein
MKPAENVLRKGKQIRENDVGGIQLKNNASTYVNVANYPPHNYYMLKKEGKQEKKKGR